MGLFDRIRQIASDVLAPSQTGAEVASVPVSVPSGLGGGPEQLLKLTGTVTLGRAAITALLARRGLTVPTSLHTDATLQREPDNDVEPDAVAVHVDGERIGYVPTWAAKQLGLPVGGAHVAPLQLFAIEQDGAVRAEAWVWVGGGSPRWQYSAVNPPAMSRQDKRQEEHQRRRRTVADALAGGGQRAQEFRAGMVDGVHYLELVEPIKQLKRENRLEEALELCFGAIAGAEGDRRGDVPAPWYTEQAAIVLRKLGRREDEIAVLRRYLAFVPAERRATHKFSERVAKLNG